MELIKENTVAYPGRVIEHKDIKYTLLPEKSLLGCNGCSLVGKGLCDNNVTKWCCQGYILKELSTNARS